MCTQVKNVAVLAHIFSKHSTSIKFIGHFLQLTTQRYKCTVLFVACIFHEDIKVQPCTTQSIRTMKDGNNCLVNDSLLWIVKRFFCTISLSGFKNGTNFHHGFAAKHTDLISHTVENEEAKVTDRLLDT